MRSIKIFLLSFCCLLLLAVPASALGSTDYILDTDRQTHIPVPSVYSVSEVYEYFGEEVGFLSEATDLYIADDDTIFIADTGNNRILHLDADGKYLKSYTAGDTLSAPQGVYVDADGDVYISDTGNNRIVHLDAAGEKIEEFIKPESDLIDESTLFEPRRIAISVQGYFYTLQGQYFMAIDAQNQFRGYVGTNKVAFNLRNLLIRTFATKEQKDKLLNQKPASYNSFDIGDDGLVYALTDESLASGQIQALNITGANIYPVRAYGERMRDGNPRFVDIAVSSQRNVYVLEQRSSRIYIYDSAGELLAVFGGEGTIKGKFAFPVAIDINSKGEVFVLDKQTGYIHRFAETVFFKQIISAVGYYNDGQYEKAMAACEEILKTDNNYPIANKKLAQCLSKFDRNEEALEYYHIAEDEAGYGTAFSKYRHELFRQYFGWIVAAVVVIFVVILLVLKFLKRRSDESLADYFGRRGVGGMKPIKKALLILYHPLDFMDILKRDYTKKSMLAAPVLMGIAVIVNYLCLFFTHYSLGGRQAIDANIMLEFAIIVLPLFSWSLAAYAMTAIMDGESRFGEILTASSYALMPYIILKPLITLASNIMGYTERGLYNTLLAIALIWVLVLLFTAFMRLNDYTFSQAVRIAFVSLFAMVVMWAVILLVCALVLQCFVFIKGVFTEFSLKYLW